MLKSGPRLNIEPDQPAIAPKPTPSSTFYVDSLENPEVTMDDTGYTMDDEEALMGVQTSAEVVRAE